MGASYNRVIQRVLFMALAGMLLATGCGEGNLSDAEHVQRGIEYREKGDLRASVIELKNALQKNPSSQTGRWELGLTYLAMDDGVKAENEILRARELGMAPEQTAVALARAQVLQGRFDQALALLDEHPAAVDDSRNLSQVYLVKGLAQLGKRELETAARLFGMALEQDPGLIEAMLGQFRVSQLSGNIDEADQWIERALALAPNDARVLRARGDVDRARGDLSAAEAAYSKAIQSAWNPFELYYHRALVRLARDNLEGFEDDLAKMRRIAAEHPMTLYLSGLWHSRNERHGQAQSDFEAVLSRLPEHQPTLYLLGASHFAQGHWNQAESHLLRYLRHNPGAPQAVLLLARIHVQAQRFDEAIAVLEQGLATTDSPQPMLSSMLASLYLSHGQQQRGLETLQAALSAEPESASLHEIMGMALMYSGERDAGLEALRKASEMDDKPRRAEAVMILAHLQAREYGEALEVAERYRDKQPDSAEAHNYRGAALIGLDRMDEAREAFSEAVKLDPEDHSAAINLGNLEMRLGRMDAAREAFVAIQEREPGHPVSAQRLAALEMQAGQPGAARRWLEDSLKTHPENLESAIMLARLQVGMGENEAALRILDEMLERHPQRLQAYYAKAGALQSMGRADDALQVLRKAEAVAPESAGVQRRLARAMEYAGERAAMLAHLRKAVELEPGHVASRVQLAMTLARSGAPESAREQLNILQARHGERVEVHALTGWFALRDGDFATGEAAYERALAQRLHRPWVMDLAQARKAHEDHAGAVAVLTRWLEHSPRDAAARHALATSQMALGDNPAAIETYETLLRDFPQNITALNNLAWLLRERDTARALELAERARQVAPESGAVQDTLGVVLYYSGDLARSARLLKELVAQSPVEPAVHYHLARTLHAQGDTEGARQHLNRALSSSGAAFPEREAAQRLQQELAR